MDVNRTEIKSQGNHVVVTSGKVVKGSARDWMSHSGVDWIHVTRSFVFAANNGSACRSSTMSRVALVRRISNTLCGITYILPALLVLALTVSLSGVCRWGN